MATASTLQPARLLPVAYFAFAHLCLPLAFAALLRRPEAMAGFFYHPRLLAVVHLVTLGWVTSYALGALYLVGALALRVPLPARGADAAVLVLHVVGVTGMVAHFWLDSPPGMAWSAGTVLAALLLFVARAAPAFARAPVPGELRAHLVLGLLNLIAAAAAGVLVAANKVRPFLPGHVLAGVAAHAHLALVGWATTLAVGVGYRLLPMLLPSAPPLGRPLWWSAALLGVGSWTLAAGLATGTAWALAGGAAVAAAVAVFLGRVGWMLRHPRPPNREHLRPDWGVLHALQALVYLALSTGLGLALLADRGALWTLRGIAVYGVLALVGFLAQLVTGVGMRLLPLHAWLRSYGGRIPSEPPPSVYALAWRPGQAASFALWTVGVPLLAAGFGGAGAAAVAAGAGALLLAALVGAAAAAWSLRPLLTAGRRAPLS
jgi:hypothetical protein